VNQNTLVSIVIPVYNVENYLKRCLDSVISQTFHNIEIIVINDGSTDSSSDILKYYAQKEPRIHLINQPNQGLSGARNTGIDAAQGEYILFVDSDDIIEPSLVEECLQLIRKEQSDVVVYGYKKVKEDMSLIAQPYLENRTFSKEEALYELLSLNISPMACNKFIRTDILKKNSINFPVAKLHEDVGTMYKIFWSAKYVTTTSKSYYYWINRETSITGTITYRHINHMVELLTDKKYFLQKNKLYSRYKDAYNLGVLKLITLMLERSLNTSKSLVEYLISYIIGQEVLISKHDVEILEKKAPCIWSRYHKLHTEGEHFLQKGDIDHNTFYALQKENRHLKAELDRVHSSIYYKLFSVHITLRDTLFPKGSTRREILKKLKGH
jgi:glycosyltransferase involved in cell wall biosynthesis